MPDKVVPVEHKLPDTFVTMYGCPVCGACVCTSLEELPHKDYCWHCHTPLDWGPVLCQEVVDNE